MSLIEDLDAEVIVVGGSVSGVHVAKTLSEKGVDVLVLDKAEFPRPKSCAGGITRKALVQFPYVKEFIDTNIYTWVIMSPNLDEGVTFHSDDLDKPLTGITLNRTDFDNKMINHLMSTTNCKVKMKTEVVDVEIKDDRAIVHAKDGKRYLSLVVIGADSTISTVSKSLGIGLFDPKLKSKRRELLSVSIEKEILFDNSEKAKKNELEVLSINSYEGLDGYVWYFPRSIGANVGVIAGDGKNQKKVLEKFIHYLIEIGKIPKNTRIVDKFNGALLPGKILYKKRIHDRVLLVGDAGGFCYPGTGEGIFPCLVSGELAGEVIAPLIKKYRLNKERNGISNGLFSKKNLKKYVKLTDTAMKNEFRLFRIAYKIMANRRFNVELIKWCQNDEKLTQNIYKSLFGEKTSISFQLLILSKYIKFKLKRKR